MTADSGRRCRSPPARRRRATGSLRGRLVPLAAGPLRRGDRHGAARREASYPSADRARGALAWFAVEPAVASAHTQQVEAPVFVEEPRGRVTSGDGRVPRHCHGAGPLDLVFQRSLDGGDMGGQRRVLGSDDRNECTTLPTATLDVTLIGSRHQQAARLSAGKRSCACAAATCATDDFVVSPSSDLVSGQVVQVSARVPARRRSPSTCEVDNRLCTNGLLTTTGAAGTLATPYTVQRTVAFAGASARPASCERSSWGSEAVRRPRLPRLPQHPARPAPTPTQRRHDLLRRRLHLVLEPPGDEPRHRPGWHLGLRCGPEGGDTTDDITVNGPAYSSGIRARTSSAGTTSPPPSARPASRSTTCPRRGDHVRPPVRGSAGHRPARG